MNMGHFINMVFKATCIKMSDYDEVLWQVVFSESIDITVHYRYEDRSFHQCTILDDVYLNE